MADARTSPCLVLRSSQISALLACPLLISHLRSAFPSSSFVSPPRHHHSIDPSATLLLMPSWSLSSSCPYLGVKLVTVFPHNHRFSLPSVAASYLLSSSLTGQPLAFMDGKEITLWRTACVSALAADFLARDDAQVLLMVGAGAMAPYLIKAHICSRPSIRKILIWNRTLSRADALAESLRKELEVEAIETCGGDLEEAVRSADLISCATLSEQPLVLGSWLKPGVHLDLVGSFTPSMKECDDDALAKGKVYIDTEAACQEAGELVGAFDRQVIVPSEIAGTLAQLAAREKQGRQHANEITVFKSVGCSLVDLATAQLIYEKHNELGHHS